VGVIAHEPELTVQLTSIFAGYVQAV